MPAERRFLAMGTTVHVVVTGGAPHLLAVAEARVADLEDRWSRFRPASELCRLNARAGRLAVVSDDTFLLVDRCVTAWSRTGGAFDPTTLPALRAAGYDADFPTVAVRDGLDEPTSSRPGAAPGCMGIELLPAVPAVRLPAGVELDGGGIGKGLAADLVTAELLAAGAAGAMVNLGGDVRVRGEPPTGHTWSIAVEHPLRPGQDLLRLGLDDGAVATSSRLVRRWTIGGEERHHLIDPATGQSVRSSVIAVTVVATDAWWAEAATKQVFVTGRPAASDGALVAVVTEDGGTALCPALEGLAA